MVTDANNDRKAGPAGLPARFFILLLLLAFDLSSCRSGPPYEQIPVPERKLNLLGLEMVATNYLDRHPEDFVKFDRMLSEADDALQTHRTLTRGAVISWIRGTLKGEGYDESMPVYLFLRSVYLRDWQGAYLSFVDEGEREYLYDLLSAVMGGMHRCSTCVIRHEPKK
jgi:hypothetical protein